MTTPIAVAAINTYLQLGDGMSPEGYTTLANVASITGPGLAANVVDVTSHSNANPWRQKITTLLDPGDVSFDLYFVPNDTGHKALLALFTSRSGGVASPFALSFPTTASRTVWTFNGWVSKFSTTEPVDNVIKAAVTITITGPPTFPA